VNFTFGLMIESLVAVLLLITIGYCMILNRRLKRLKGDEQALKATISELITATEIAGRAVAGLKATAQDCDGTLGERMRAAERLAAGMDRQLKAGELLLSELIRSGALLRHLASSHRTYAARRERFAAACAVGLPDARVHGIQAGLHLVLTFGDGFDDQAASAALERAGLLCEPLSSYYHGERRPATGLVCGYARLPETLAPAAVEVIASVLG